MTESVTSAGEDSSTSSTKSKAVVTSALICLGIVLIGAGVVAVFRTTNDVGSAALLSFGGVLFVLGAMGDRLESLRYGDLEVVLRRKAKEAAKKGETETAEVLERAADRISGRAKKIQRSYQAVRTNMPSGAQRTALMDQIIREARADAHDPDLDEERVLGLLWTGSEGARVWALGVLQERPQLATVRAVLEAVIRPDQMFDQYQALLLAERYLALPDVREWPRKRIQQAVRIQFDSGALGKDQNSLSVAKRIIHHPPSRT
ncbi:hypothetical protein ASH01_19585 [Terrabacter sp. Soil811]|uniref:hypothetical protein n=1 Tax=Terrabacter sp. Soil811 TaxID=1736419 RepID=UPI00070001EF|nr:hypothetical protein [Terrabacter sp. Soil811]KRF39992.1 hypothetical protein ASH01_19585 [Terrabacter sp. Soil811]